MAMMVIVDGDGDAMMLATDRPGRALDLEPRTPTPTSTSS
jgi:hypothetical protein